MSELYSKNQILEMIGHDQEELDLLMKMFIDLSPQMLDEIDFFISKNNFKSAGDVAHKLKSSVRLWDIDSILEDVLFIEVNGKNETQTEQIKPKAEKVRTILQEVLEQMKEEINYTK
jgi:HPt (histidine-containing phosphotransfer) domain-containing protein